MTLKKFVDESKKTWEIAAPAILTAVFQFSIAFISSAFAGHIGDLELAAVAVSENVLEGFVYGVMLGMGIMLCLELWYYTAVILMVGGLKNPKIAVDSISICINFLSWALMITLGFNASVSVRVSNEIGAGNSKAAKYSVGINLLTSTAIALFFSIAICASTNHFPMVFSHNDTVVKEAAKLTYLLAAAIFLNGILPVLHGVAVGLGWQVSVAVINLACYYILGLPIGALLGFKFGLNVRGVWIGMLLGSLVQAIILLFIVYHANWNKEVMKAEIRMMTYDDEENDRGNSRDPPADDRNNSRDPPADYLNNSRDLPADSNSTRS
ncbi:hypothetical protein MLD38_032081 [Melastoma candidum]|uniref:Uncharacterized protein n=1 Tax=Melastoma candidum TaxID=119954 RepID=A0ACB9M366_9MYRT|nr:hypothetical protein MLD38_032081 [Melastoma candidum]